MRDVFGFNFSKEESKEAVATEDTKFKGIHISSNGYYGYQLVQSNEKTTEDHFEFMDVQCNGHNDDSDIQFNNFIRPEERLCSEPVAITVMRESVNRKRPLNYDVTVDCKKRREDAPITELHQTCKYLNSRQPTHNVPDMPRNLMGHFI
ncbi:hypothetical protein RN001_003245 [Aquatica leii]|uniref:Uncharacterized protein n=1 Tax=Aquatica leii TaxID=1421715 RepID=A0AAN7PI18_9COLE|nr:hypothetical protein RN001_003245 [Aquatica leii]